MTPVDVFFCWQGGAERDFVNSTNVRRMQQANLVVIAQHTDADSGKL